MVVSCQYNGSGGATYLPSVSRLLHFHVSKIINYDVIPKVLIDLSELYTDTSEVPVWHNGWYANAAQLLTSFSPLLLLQLASSQV